MIAGNYLVMGIVVFWRSSIEKPKPEGAVYRTSNVERWIHDLSQGRPPDGGHRIRRSSRSVAPVMLRRSDEPAATDKTAAPKGAATDEAAPGRRGRSPVMDVGGPAARHPRVRIQLGGVRGRWSESISVMVL